MEPCTSGLCGFPAKEVVGNFPLVRIQQVPYGKKCSYYFFMEKVIHFANYASVVQWLGPLPSKQVMGFRLPFGALKF